MLTFHRISQSAAVPTLRTAQHSKMRPHTIRDPNLRNYQHWLDQLTEQTCALRLKNSTAPVHKQTSVVLVPYIDHTASFDTCSREYLGLSSAKCHVEVHLRSGVPEHDMGN